VFMQHFFTMSRAKGMKLMEYQPVAYQNLKNQEE
jgi:hypothetical protein